jgi:hypothetical protein
VHRVFHSVITDCVIEVMDASMGHERLRSEAFRIISRFLFAYTDTMVALLTHVYDSERRNLLRGKDRRRRQLVGELLDGLPVEDVELAYRIRGLHWAAVATGHDCDRDFTRIAALVGLELLTVPSPSGGVWVWFGGGKLSDSDVQQRILSEIPATMLTAFGEVAPGLDGFRASHREALRAYRIACNGPHNVVRYRDCALLSLATMDETLARQFVVSELGFLADDTPRASELRMTLRTYFECGHNAAAAAERLSLNDRTVAYRLRTIEERMARPVVARRDELSIALRLLDYYTVA